MAPNCQDCPSLHIKRGGRIALVGGPRADIEVPYVTAVVKRLKIVGSWMCNRQTMQRTIRMVELGQLDIGPNSGMDVKTFPLEDLYKAIEDVETTNVWRVHTAITPNP
jgi:D-arabinose 1-dehydrogenase-like Zn-dependent alcohol dehydrogenase